MTRLKKINYSKIIKIVSGFFLAAAIAFALNLSYAVSAGVICLLTIQDTKKETLLITLKRLIAFGAVTLLCAVIFGNFGYSILSLAAAVGLFLFICAFFDMNEAIAMNSVIATHYFSSADCSGAMILNEFLLLAAGAGTGVILNLFTLPDIKRIRAVQSRTDDRIKRIIGRMSVYIMKEDKTGYDGSCFEEVSSLLDDLRREALRYTGNHFGGESGYFFRYVKLRITQCEVLKRIYNDIIRLSPVEKFGRPIADFLKKMSGEFHEINDAVSLTHDIEQLFEHYSAQELPRTRSEFESRALMYHILWDLEYFVRLKQDFAVSVSEKERRKFWDNDGSHQL